MSNGINVLVAEEAYIYIITQMLYAKWAIWGWGWGIMICFTVKWSSIPRSNREEHGISCSFYLSIYLTASRESERRGKKNAKGKIRRGREGGGWKWVALSLDMKVLPVAARTPKCPQGRTVDSCRTQKGHTGVRLTAAYTIRATRLVRDARAALCYMYRVFRT